MGISDTIVRSIGEVAKLAIAVIVRLLVLGFVVIRHWAINRRTDN